MDRDNLVAPQSTPTEPTNGDAPLARPHRRVFSWTWLGVAPFFLFAILFLFLPSVSISVRSFESLGGGLTLQNFADIFEKSDIRNAYAMSIKVSAITALGGALFGFLLRTRSSWVG